MRDILENTWLKLFKTVKVIKKNEKKSIRNWQRQEATKETGWLNAVWDFGRDPGTGKEH